MRHDLLSDALTCINNAEKIGKRICNVPSSKLIKNVLMVIKEAKYIQNFTASGKYEFAVELKGRINKIKAIKPRFSIHSNEYKKWENRYLPSKDFGILLISTSQGVMNQRDAEKKHIGGRILAYVY